MARQLAANEYRDYTESRDYEIDLTLTEQELVSLELALRDCLAKHGVAMVHEQVIQQQHEFHPNSHIGTLVKLAARVDAALHGRKNWNR
jgi:hypothetical protein